MSQTEGRVNSLVSEVSFGGHEFCVFVRQLATLVASGVPIHTSLEILAKQYEQNLFGSVLNDVSDRVSGGSRLSLAMSVYPRIFDHVFTSMIRIGEETGGLHRILDRLADWKERDYVLRRRVQAALLYPAFILLVTLVLILFIFWYIVPNFVGVFAELRLDPPLVTRLVLIISDILTSPIFLLCSTTFIAFGVAMLRHQWSTRKGREQVYELIHRLPVFGQLVRLTAVTRFAGGVQTLTAAGLPLKLVLELGGQSSGNPVMMSAAETMAQSVVEGEMFSGYITERSDLFPVSFAQYASTGEESGELEKMMGAANVFYSEDLKNRIETAVSLIEPLLMGGVSIIVGIVMVALASSAVALFQ